MHGEDERKAVLKPLLTTLLDGAATRISRSVGRSAMSDFQFASNNTCPNKVHLSSTSVNGAEQQVPNRRARGRTPPLSRRSPPLFSSIFFLAARRSE